MQRASLMEESVWHKMIHGSTTRCYSQVFEELEQAYGIKKSTISEHFIEASRQRLDKLLARRLNEHALCAMMIDGTPFGDQQLITAIGLTVHGHKLVLGLRQGVTENATVVKQLLDDVGERGVDFEVPRLYVLDGGKALFAGVRRVAAKAAVVQRCQVHKIRNVIDHLPEEHHGHVR
jgi:transposase-like protein